ncbi:MAG TPA: AI-2E family transporter [Steroidobacteraceae bacterium]|nr:AI-2E family transporter [Steroidobacteraceae bacterium]
MRTGESAGSGSTPGGDARFYERLVAIAGLALLAALLYQILEPFFAPLAWAIFLGFLLQPAQARLTGWLRGRDSICAFLLTILVLLLFIGPLTALAVAFARQAADLAGLLQQWLTQHQGRGLPELTDLPVLGRLLEWLDQYTRVSTAKSQAFLLEGAKRLFEQLAASGGGALLGAIGTVLSFTIMLFLLFFFIRDGHSMASAAINLVPLAPSRRDELRDQLAAVTHAVVRGTVVTAAIQGLLLGIGFAVVGLPAPVVFGVIAAVLSVVPFGGTALVWMPAVGVLLFQGRYVAAIALIAIGVLVSTVDNILKPLLISGRATLPTLAVFIGVLGGIVAFGMIGMFLGPVVIALTLALVNFAQDTQQPTPR